MKNQNNKGRLIAKVLGGLLFLGVFIFNVMVFVQNDKSTGNLSFASLKAFAQTGGSGSGSGSGGCGSGCSAGYACVNGVCRALETPQTEPCTKKKSCGVFSSVTTYGNEQNCKIDSGGSATCKKIACDAANPMCP